MANNNIYGTVKQAQFNPSTDADVYYYYRPTHAVNDNSFSGFRKIEKPETILEQSKLEKDSSFSEDDLILPGMFTLKLPVNIFGETGVYTIYITPKEIECKIVDVGILAAYPEIKGIVLEVGGNLGNFSNDDSLVGYQVIYYTEGKRQDFFRLITTNTKCSVMSQNLTSSTSNSSAYRYNQSGSLMFLTLTPSLSPSYKTNSNPYIGIPGQTILLKNTKFDPLCVEVEITDHDIETVSYMLEGEQVRNYENGRVTTYNFNGEIYKQMEYMTVKDNYTTNNIAEVKIDRSNNIDNSIDLNTIKE